MDGDWDLGLGSRISIGDWEWGLGVGDCDYRLILGIGIRDWDLGLGWRIRIGDWV